MTNVVSGKIIDDHLFVNTKSTQDNLLITNEGGAREKTIQLL